MLISYSWIIANYHQGITANNKILIWMPGMPVMPKNTNDSDVSVFLAWWFDVLMPEYYGSFRSEWEFSIENCFKTIEQTLSLCISWNAHNLDKKKDIDFKYDSIFLLWSSFSAYFIMRYKDLSKVKWLGFAYPMLTKLTDIGYIEEKPEDVEYELHNRWSSYFYRFPKNQSFREFYDALEEDNDTVIQNLLDKPIFIGHGTADTCIHYSRSEAFFKQLSQGHKDNMLVPIPWKNHWSHSRWDIVTEFVKRSLAIE